MEQDKENFGGRFGPNAGMINKVEDLKRKCTKYVGELAEEEKELHL